MLVAQVVAHKISLTVVACNESNRLKDFLEYHKPLVDEIVIAVQKSEDNSLEIAKQYADKVFDVPCTGYCESHRELVSKEASYDWQLCLDVDERITKEFAEIMYSLISEDIQGYKLFRRLHYKGDVYTNGKMHRFYNRNFVKFLDELHTEPQALDWTKTKSYPLFAIEHIKSEEESESDKKRYISILNKDRSNPLFHEKLRASMGIEGI